MIESNHSNYMYMYVIWAMSWDNLSVSYMQTTKMQISLHIHISDQCLCYLLPCMYNSINTYKRYSQDLISS